MGIKKGHSRSELLDLAPPSNVDMERQILGGLFVTTRDVDREMITAWLHEKDFFDPFYSFMFRELRTIVHLKIPMTSVAIIQSMTERSTLRRAKSRFHENIAHDIGAMIADGLDCHAHFRHYSDVLRRLRIKRAHIQIATDMLQSAWDETKSPEDVRKMFYGSMKSLRETVPEHMNGGK